MSTAANSKKNWQKKDPKSALAMARWLYGPAAGTSRRETEGEVSQDGGSSAEDVKVMDKEKEKLPAETPEEEKPVPEEFVECFYAECEDDLKNVQELGFDDQHGFQGHRIPKVKRNLLKDDELVLKAVMTLI